MKLSKALALTLGLTTLVSVQMSAAGKKDANPIFDKYFSQPVGASISPDAEGFIRRWTVLEPISKPNRGNTVFTDTYVKEVFAKEYFAGQQEVIPTDGQKVKAMVEKVIVDPKAPPQPRYSMEPQKTEWKKETLLWHSVDSKLFNVKLFRFADAFEKPHYGVIFWAVTVINCEEDMENVRLAVGSNSASQWWLNGEEVALLTNDRRMVQDDVVSKRINLKKGKNILRGAIINGPGMSDFCVRFLDEQGNPVTNITISNQ